MRIKFTEAELTKLDELLQMVLPAARLHRDEDGGRTLRTFKKMQYKFRPPGSVPVVFLGKKERDVLAFMVKRRIDAAMVPALELTLKSIAEKLDV